jgi:GrpB-like predicted nucleotidyltransferase (UPF0157 family)
LRENDWARKEYQKMKYYLSEKANQNRKVYTAFKEIQVNDFIVEAEKRLF